MLRWSCTTRRPYAFVRPSITTTCSPDRGGARKSNLTTLRRLGSSIFSILSSALTRLCTCAALAACAAKPVDEALLLGQHGLLTRVGRLAVRLAERALALVEVVVAGVDRDLAAIDLGDLRHDAVHELAVVRCHQQRTRQRLQERLEPDDRLDVEVVRRLVHQQDVGAPQQHARHRDAHLPSSRQVAHVSVDPLVVEAEPEEHFPCLGLERVAPEVVVLLLHFAEPVEDAVHPVGLRRVAHGVLQRFEFVVEVAEAATAGNRLVEHRAARHLLDVLPEVADGQLARDGDLAFVCRLLADDHPEERGLAGAVRADEAHLLAGIQLERGVDEQDLAAVLLVDARKRDHRDAVTTGRVRLGARID